MILLRFLDAQRQNIVANFYNSWKSELSFKRVLMIGLAHQFVAKK